MSEKELETISCYGLENDSHSCKQEPIYRNDMYFATEGYDFIDDENEYKYCNDQIYIKHLSNQLQSSIDYSQLKDNETLPSFKQWELIGEINE